MTVIVLLIIASLAVAILFLGGFIWAVRSGQFEDTCTPSLRVLTDDEPGERPLFSQPRQTCLSSDELERRDSARRKAVVPPTHAEAVLGAPIPK
jgi:cbb3-type cytochrome oxidase maturation protein